MKVIAWKKYNGNKNGTKYWDYWGINWWIERWKEVIK